MGSALKKKGTQLPEPFPFDEARALFKTPEVADMTACDFKWEPPDTEGLLKYLVEEKQFAEERVTKAIERLKKCKGKNTQNRLESFFGPSTVVVSEKKRKEADLKKSKLASKGKGSSSSGAKKFKSK